MLVTPLKMGGQSLVARPYILIDVGLVSSLVLCVMSASSFYEATALLESWPQRTDAVNVS